MHVGGASCVCETHTHPAGSATAEPRGSFPARRFSALHYNTLPYRYLPAAVSPVSGPEVGQTPAAAAVRPGGRVTST